MPEGVLLLILDRRTAYRADELSARELVQALAHRLVVGVEHGRDGPGPEGSPDDRRTLDEHLTLRAQRVQTRRDQPLNRLGDRDLCSRRDGGDGLAPPEEPTVEQHADELFRVERIATGALEQDRTRIRRQCRL